MADKTPPRKVRTDSVLRHLPEERQLEIYARLKTESADAVRKWLREGGLEIGTTALYQFAAYWRSELRFLEGQARREALLAQMLVKQSPAKLAKLEAWADAMFIVESAAEGNLEGYVKMRAITERARQTRLDERRLAMLEDKERKLAELEKSLKEKQAAGGLSAETLEVIESALGMI